MAKRGGFPGGMPGNMNNLMKQAQRMQRQMETQQAELEAKEFSAASGGGVVEVTVSGKPISYTILLLLFLLGISVGANESIVNNLTTLGGQALLIASAGTLGSVLAAWGVYHFFFKERSRG